MSKEVHPCEPLSVKKLIIFILFCLSILISNKPTYAETLYADVMELDAIRPMAEHIENSDYNGQNYNLSKSVEQVEQQSSQEQGDDFLTGLMSNGRSQQITPDPNETIDLFSGAFHLIYKDISVPVAPGLNMEFVRSYSSEIYDKFPFIAQKNHQHNMLQNGWHMHGGYFEKGKKCDYLDNRCSGVFVDNAGIKHPLLIDNHKSLFLASSKDHFQVKYVKDGMEILAPNGLKYYLENQYYLEKTYRFYVTKVETPDGNHAVHYHYNGSRLVKITSTDPGKVIDIAYQDIETRPGHKNRDTVKAPVFIYYNGNLMASYSYTFISKKKHVMPTLALTGVILANGLEWKYKYKILDLRVDGKEHSERTDRAFLEEVTHPDKELTKYQYSLDKSLRYNGEIYSTRLAIRDHKGENKIDDGVWKFELSEGPVKYGTATRQVKVINPNFTTDYLYNSYQKGNLWKLGLPAEINIYKDHNEGKDNIIQKENFIWQSVFHGKYKFIATVKHSSDIWDNHTYRAVLSEKTITRGNDKYKSVYTDYDEYDNPQLITQTNNNNTRIIRQNYINLIDKNIFGLKQSLSVNNKTLYNNQFDENGSLVSSEKFGKVKKYKYQNGLLAEYIDGYGNITMYKNYVSGIPELIQYPDSTNEHNTVNQFGLVETAINKNGFAQNHIYNNYGQLISSILPEGQVTEYDYQLFDKHTKHGQYVLHEKYNAYNQLILQQENNENKILIKYDALGNKIFQSHLSGINATSNNGHYYSFDSLGRLLSDCEGTSINDKSRCVYNKYLPGNKVKIQFPNGEYVIYSYQAYGDPDNGHLISIEQEGRKTTISRGDLGNVLSVKQGEITKQYTYDNNLNLIKYQEPETGETTYQYDKVGNLILKAQGGVKTSYQYNSKNYNLEYKHYSDESFDEEFKYDQIGNLVKAIKGDVETSYGYNQNNLLVYEKLAVNLGGERKILKAKYSYDNNGHLSAINYPDGSTLDYAPNSYGQPTRIGNYINHINYYNNHHWSDYSLGNGIIAKAGLDESMRLNKLQYGNLDLNFSYDSNNNLVNYYLLDHANHSFDYAMEFTYDKTGRIKSSKGPWGKLDYNYDPNDNILSIRNSISQKTFNGDIHLDYKNNRLDSIANNSRSAAVLGNFTYDSLGNIKQDANNRYLYGADGNLLTAMGGENATYGYDVKNNRVLKNIAGNNIITLYNQAGQGIYEVDLVKQTETKYIYFNGKRIAEDIKQGNSNIVNYYYNDYLGNPIAMADSTGKTLWHEIFQPFGAKYFDAGSKYGFIGKEIDKNNLSYFGARYYNTQLGRFMAPDPVAVNPENPATFNRYAYSANNPYKYVDEDGRAFEVAPPHYYVAKFFVGGAYAAFPYAINGQYKEAVIAGFIGGFTSVVADPLIGRVVAMEYLAGSYMAKVGAEIGLGTASGAISSKLNTGSFNIMDSLKSSIYARLAGMKLNPAGIDIKTVSGTLLYDNLTNITSATFVQVHNAIVNSSNDSTNDSDDKKNFSRIMPIQVYASNNMCYAVNIGMQININ